MKMEQEKSKITTRFQSFSTKEMTLSLIIRRRNKFGCRHTGYLQDVFLKKKKKTPLSRGLLISLSSDNAYLRTRKVWGGG